MLTDYLDAPDVVARLRGGPAGSYVDEFSAWLGSAGYKRTTVRGLIRGLERFADWATCAGLDVGKLDGDAVDRFHEHLASAGRRRHRCGSQTEDVTASRRFVRFLRKCNGGTDGAATSNTEPKLLSEFYQWMAAHRGTGESTLKGYGGVIKELLDVLGDATESYQAVKIRSFVLARAGRHGISATRHIVTSLRMFLRFLVATKRCSVGLAASVPVIAEWQRSSLPRYLPAADVDQLIASCDDRTTTALRDKAIMLLGWRLGLRAGDVAGLAFEDIDWEGGRLRVSGKSRREVWLPIPQDVGEAIIDYLERGRPRGVGSHVFMKAVAPHGSMSSELVSTVVRRAMDRAGIKATSRGLHVLRHSAATAMLRDGATLHEIGSVLRHASIETTFRYAKVDMDLLTTVTAPWPAPPETIGESGLTDPPSREVTPC